MQKAHVTCRNKNAAVRKGEEEEKQGRQKKTVKKHVFTGHRLWEPSSHENAVQSCPGTKTIEIL